MVGAVLKLLGIKVLVWFSLPALIAVLFSSIIRLFFYLGIFFRIGLRVFSFYGGEVVAAEELLVGKVTRKVFAFINLGFGLAMFLVFGF